MKFNKTLWMSAVVLTAVIACKKDLYDPIQADETLHEIYTANFKAKFGAVPSDFSWDASTMTPMWSAVTRLTSDDITFSTSDYKIVQENLLNYMNNNLIEGATQREDGKTNRDLYGEPFMMVVPNNEFTIQPIYQGHASTIFDFCIVVDGVEKTVWSKGEDVMVYDSVYTRPAPIGNAAPGPWEFNEELSGWRSINETENTLEHTTLQRFKNDKWENATVDKATKKTVYCAEIKTKSYTFDLSQYAGKLMSMHLYVTKGANNYSKTGAKMSSLDKMMVSLSKECPVPEGLPTGTQTMIIGCECANLSSSDWDMNDVVFLIYGNPRTPQVVEMKDDMIDLTICKRYMFEDLGSTDDFDFNDVVLDLFDTRTMLIHKEGNVQIGKPIEVEGTRRQRGVISHLGGTIPVELYVAGKRIWAGGCTSTFNKNVHIELQPSENGSFGWIPEENNVSLHAQQKAGEDVDSGEEIFTDYSSSFPTLGHPAPMIIATDTIVKWMSERTCITMDWFNQVAKKE